MLHADRDLAIRLEGCEATTASAFVDTHARLEPTSGAAWLDAAGVRAMFDGVGSPMTQTFGLGVLGPGDDTNLDAIEAFFSAHGSEINHELSPLAGVEVSARLVERGYRPIEQSNVLVRELDTLPAARGGFRFGVAAPDERESWVGCSAAGWSADPAIAEFIAHFGRLSFSNPAVVSVAAFDEGVMVATGSMAVHHDIALLAGASTPPAHRGRGAQNFLLAERLRLARERGCKVAMMVTLPGSTSQRNAERNGFAVAYTRTKWSRPART